MDELDLRACFIFLRLEFLDESTRAWHYERGTWTTLMAKEAITDYCSKADLCFVVRDGDTQLGTNAAVCYPRTREFYPLVRLDTGAFWHAGARIRAR